MNNILTDDGSYQNWINFLIDKGATNHWGMGSLRPDGMMLDHIGGRHLPYQNASSFSSTVYGDGPKSTPDFVPPKDINVGRNAGMFMRETESFISNGFLEVETFPLTISFYVEWQPYVDAGSMGQPQYVVSLSTRTGFLGSYGWWVDVDQYGHLIAGLWLSEGSAFTGLVDLSDQKGHWITVVFDKDVCSIYDNGQIVQYNIGLGFIPTPSDFAGAYFTLGAYGNAPMAGVQGWRGVLDEFVVFSYAFGDQDALDLYNFFTQDALTVGNGPEYVSWEPAILQADPNVANVLQGYGKEIVRIDYAWQDLLDQLFVQTATWGMRYWEAMLELPVEPLGQPLTQRRTVALAALTARVATSGAEFNAALQRVSQGYTLTFDQSSSTLHITLSYDPGAYTTDQLDTIIKKLIPATIPYDIQYSSFIVGVGKAGDTL